jgi:hypothetical protein
MILLYCLSFLFVLLVVWYVVSPLFSSNYSQANSVSQLSTLLSGFSSAEELSEVLEERDEILKEFVSKNGVLSPERQTKLFSLLHRLKAAGFPAFPKNLEGFVKVFLVCVLSFVVGQKMAFAQGEMPEIPESSVVTLSAPTFVPSVNQYVLSPREGKMHVYYLGIVKRPKQNADIKFIALPFPPEIGELVLPDLPKAIVEKESNGVLAIQLDGIQENQEIRAEFSVNAKFGNYSWANPQFPKASGVYLFLLPEISGELRTMFESVFTAAKTWNMWPPRFHEVSSDLRLVRQPDRVNPQDPNYEMLQKLPPAFTWNAIRMSRTAESFPEFKIVGLVPSRLWLVALGICFALVLAGSLAVRWKRI